MTQKMRIMSILKEGVELTSLDGLKIGIIRITNRVNELIHSGVPIKSRWEVRNKKRFKVYFLENVEESMKRFCPDCVKDTLQVVKLKDPDNIESGEVWECSVCHENTAWVE